MGIKDFFSFSWLRKKRNKQQQINISIDRDPEIPRDNPQETWEMLRQSWGSYLKAIKNDRSIQTLHKLWKRINDIMLIVHSEGLRVARNNPDDNPKWVKDPNWVKLKEELDTPMKNLPWVGELYYRKKQNTEPTLAQIMNLPPWAYVTKTTKDEPWQTIKTNQKLENHEDTMKNWLDYNGDLIKFKTFDELKKS